MAITECEECGKSVSTHANSCPNCGCPQQIMFSKYLETKEFFDDNGELKSRGSLNIKGEEEGKWSYFHKNGKVWKEVIYKGGLMHGEEKSWNGEGKKFHTANYKDGKKHGRDLSWYPNGQKKIEQNWHYDKLHGYQTWWYENEQKEEETFYEKGKLLTAKRWNWNGYQCQKTNVINGNGKIVRDYTISCSKTGVSLINGPFEEEVYKNGYLVEEQPAGTCPICEYPYYNRRPSECQRCCHDYLYEEEKLERRARNINILWWVIGIVFLIINFW